MMTTTHTLKRDPLSSKDREKMNKKSAAKKNYANGISTINTKQSKPDTTLSPADKEIPRCIYAAKNENSTSKNAVKSTNQSKPETTHTLEQISFEEMDQSNSNNKRKRAPRSPLMLKKFKTNEQTSETCPTPTNVGHDSSSVVSNEIKTSLRSKTDLTSVRAVVAAEDSPVPVTTNIIKKQKTSEGSRQVYVYKKLGTQFIDEIFERKNKGQIDHINQVKDKHGHSPIPSLILYGKTEYVICRYLKLLIDNVLDVNAVMDDGQDNGLTPLMLACCHYCWQRPSVCKVLIDAGANVNAVANQESDNPSNPLSFACNRGYTTTVQMLIEHGADVYPTLIEACRKGNDKIVNTLIDGGADFRQIVAGAEYSPLIEACHNGSHNIVKALVDYGVDVRQIVAGESPLTKSVQAVISSKRSILKTLLNHGADIYEIVNGRSALTLAMESEKKWMVEFMKKVQSGKGAIKGTSCTTKICSPMNEEPDIMFATNTENNIVNMICETSINHDEIEKSDDETLHPPMMPMSPPEHIADQIAVEELLDDRCDHTQKSVCQIIPKLDLQMALPTSSLKLIADQMMVGLPSVSQKKEVKVLVDDRSENTQQKSLCQIIPTFDLQMAMPTSSPEHIVDQMMVDLSYISQKKEVEELLDDCLGNSQKSLCQLIPTLDLQMAMPTSSPEHMADEMMADVSSLSQKKKRRVLVDDRSKNTQQQSFCHLLPTLDLQMAKQLISNMTTLDLDHVEGNGDSAIHIAFRCKKYNIVKMLAKNGANLEIQDSIGKTIFHLLAAEYRKKDQMIKLAEALLESSHHHVDLAIRDSDYNCPAHIAFRYKNYELVKIFIKYGFDPNKLDKFKLNIFHRALRIKQYNIIRLCLKYGADRELPDDTGITSNHFVANVQDDKLMKLFYRKEENKFVTNGIVSYDRNDATLRQYHNNKSLFYIVARGFFGILLVGVWYIQNYIHIALKTEGEYLIDILGYYEMYLVNASPWKHIPFIVAITLSSIVWYMFH